MLAKDSGDKATTTVEFWYMSGVERGVRNPSALQLLKLARALRIQVGDFFRE